METSHDPAPSAPLATHRVGPRAAVRLLRGYLLAFVAAFLVVTFLVTTVGVVGRSMRPTLAGGAAGDAPARAALVGDRVLIPKLETWLRRTHVLGPFERGAIVVLREPRTAPEYHLRRLRGCFESALLDRCRPFFIKRIVGAPGDLVAIDAGRVRVNGVALDQGFITGSGEVRVQPVVFPRVIVEGGRVSRLEIGFADMGGGVPYPILPTVRSPTGFVPIGDPRIALAYGPVARAIVAPAGAPEGVPVLGQVRVPAGHYFVLGDNRAPLASEDSRYFGAVPAIDVAGRAAAVVWPPVRDGRLNWRLLEPPTGFRAIPTP